MGGETMAEHVYEVSTLVNSPANDSSECVSPERIAYLRTLRDAATTGRTSNDGSGERRCGQHTPDARTPLSLHELGEC